MERGRYDAIVLCIDFLGFEARSVDSEICEDPSGIEIKSRLGGSFFCVHVSKSKRLTS